MDNTIEQFITKHGLKFECRRVESRPDGLMSDTRPEADTVRHFRCKIIGRIPVNIRKHDHLRSFSIYFSQDSAHTVDPTLADVLDCLAGDASGWEAATPIKHETDSGVTHFDSWAAEYGYDTDSRKAEKTFKAIKRQSEQMRRVLGAEAYEELLYNTERL